MSRHVERAEGGWATFIWDTVFFGYFSHSIRNANRAGALTQKDLPELWPADDVSYWSHLLSKACESMYRWDGSVKRFAVVRSLVCVFYCQLLLIFAISMINVGLSAFSIAMSVGFINVLGTGLGSSRFPAQAVLLQAGLIAAQSLLAECGAILTKTHLEFWKHRMAMRMEGSLNGVVYRRALSAPVTTAKKTSDHDSTSAHNVIVLDVPSVARFFTTMTDIVMVPVYCYWIYMLLQQMTAQLPAVMGLITLIGTIGTCMIIEMINGYLKIPLLRARDRRIARTEEVLTQVKELRQLGVQDLAAKEVTDTRNAELRVRCWRMFMHCFTWALSDSIKLILQVVVLGTHYWSVRRFPGKTMTAAAAIGVLRVTSKFVEPLSKMSQTAHTWMESWVAISRCSQHLYGSASDGSDPKLTSITETATNHFNGPMLVSATNATFAVGIDRRLVIENMNLKRGEVAFIVGTAGGGKSSAILALAGELPVLDGGSYARWAPALSSRATAIAKRDGRPLPKALGLLRQDPWLNDGSVKSLITFCREHDDYRLSTVLSAVGLDFDISTWPEGRDRRVIQGGVNLSGGQRVRMALCRAIYSYPIPEAELPAEAFHGCVDKQTRLQGCDVFLLDSAFQGLDPRLALAIFKNLFGPKGLLRHAASVVTVDLSLLRLFLCATDLGVKVKFFEAENCRVRPMPDPRDLVDEDLLCHAAQSLNSNETVKAVLARATSSKQDNSPRAADDDQEDDEIVDRVEVNSRSVMNMYATTPTRATYYQYLCDLGFKRSIIIFLVGAVQLVALLSSNWMAALWNTAATVSAVEVPRPTTTPPVFADAVRYSRKPRNMLPPLEPPADGILDEEMPVLVDVTKSATAAIHQHHIDYEHEDPLEIGSAPLNNAWPDDDTGEALLSQVVSSVPLASSMKHYVQASAPHPEVTEYRIVPVFVSVSVIALLLACVTTAVLTGQIMRSCRVVHERLLNAVLNAPFWVFDQLGVGVLMTHFNADMHKYDTGPVYDLMQCYRRTLMLCLTLLSLAVLSAWMLPLLPLVGVPLYFCAFRYYQPATRCFVSAKLNCYPPLFGGLTDVNLTAVETRCAGVAEVQYEIHENHIRALMRAEFAMSGNNCWAISRMQMITTPVTAFSYVIPLLRPYLPLNNAMIRCFLPEDWSLSPGVAGLGIDMGCRVPGALLDAMLAKNHLSHHFVSVQRINDMVRLLNKVGNEQRRVFVPGPVREIHPKAEPNCRCVGVLRELTCCYLRVTKPAVGKKRATRLGFDDVQIALQAPTVNHVTGAIERGEVVGVAGRSGAGKSSMLLALTNRMARRYGTFQICDKDVAHMNDEQLGGLLGYLPQHAAIMGGWTVRYVLDPAGRMPDQYLWAVLRSLQLYSIVKAAPDKLDAVVADESWKEATTRPVDNPVENGGDNGEVEEGDEEEDEPPAVTTYDDERRSSTTDSGTRKASVVEKKAASRLMTDSQVRLLWLGRLALRGSYKMVLIDEPPHKQRDDDMLDIVPLVRSLFPETAVIIVAHHADVLRMCDTVWMMHNSRLMRVVAGEEIKDEATLSTLLRDLAGSSTQSSGATSDA